MIVDDELHPQVPNEEVTPDEEPGKVETSEDYWTFSGDALTRHHITPRLKLYKPTQDDLPMPIEYLDIDRYTKTDLETKNESIIFDYWHGNRPSLLPKW